MQKSLKKISIDLTKLDNLNCGLGQVVYHIGKYLATRTDAEKYEFLVANNKLVGCFGNAVSYKTFGLMDYLFTKNNYSVCYLAHQNIQFKLSRKRFNVITIHDLNFMYEKTYAKQQKYLKRVKRNIDYADTIVFISEFVKNMVNKHIHIDPQKEQKIIYNGVNIDTQKEVAKPHFLDTSNFIFTIGEIKRKKNFHVLIDFVAHLDKSIQLIIVGNDNTDYATEIKTIIKQKGLSNRIIVPGIVSEEDKIYLYKNCKALVFPSLLEGFGLPVIEAMRFGKPVFLSQHTSLPEIAGNLGFYWEFFEGKYMANFFNEKMKMYENDLSFSKKLIIHSQKYTWDKSIELYAKILNRYHKKYHEQRKIKY